MAMTWNFYDKRDLYCQNFIVFLSGKKVFFLKSSITLKMSVLDHLHRSLSIIYIKIPLFNSNCSYHVGPEKPQALPLLSDFDK